MRSAAGEKENGGDLGGRERGDGTDGQESQTGQRWRESRTRRVSDEKCVGRRKTIEKRTGAVAFQRRCDDDQGFGRAISLDVDGDNVLPLQHAAPGLAPIARRSD